MAGLEERYPAELQRKALHLVALVIPLCILTMGRVWSLTALVPVTIAAIVADLLRVRSARFARFIDGTFGFMMRPAERPPLGSRPVLNGATWVLISATLLVFVFPTAIAAAAFATFMVADAAAAVVGRRFGVRRWGSGPRTIEGSAAFVVVGVPLLAAFPDVTWWIAIAAVLPGALVEIPSRPLNDNVRVPLVMALVLSFLTM